MLQERERAFDKGISQGTWGHGGYGDKLGNKRNGAENQERQGEVCTVCWGEERFLFTVNG